MSSPIYIWKSIGHFPSSAMHSAHLEFQPELWQWRHKNKNLFSYLEVQPCKPESRPELWQWRHKMETRLPGSPTWIQSGVVTVMPQNGNLIIYLEVQPSCFVMDFVDKVCHLPARAEDLSWWRHDCSGGFGHFSYIAFKKARWQKEKENDWK